MEFAELDGSRSQYGTGPQIETRVGFGSSANEGGLGVEEEEETELEPRRESSSQ